MTNLKLSSKNYETEHVILSLKIKANVTEWKKVESEALKRLEREW